MFKLLLIVHFALWQQITQMIMLMNNSFLCTPYTHFPVLDFMEDEKRIVGASLGGMSPAVTLPPSNSSQSISPQTLAEPAGGSSYASSPKVPIYNNHAVNDQQRCSPSINSSLKRVLSRSGTPSSSNASLHLKIGTPKSAAGDVYDFHSSPEEDNVPTSSSGFFFASVPAAGVLQPKGFATIHNNVLENLQPPQKRIKTAILAKKLLAAAADSNIIDSVGLAQSNGTAQTSALDEHSGRENSALLSEEAQKETEGEGLFEDDEEEAEEQEERELDEQTPSNEERATSVLVQEQKKVPPLRISLLKTPSEEGTDASAHISPPLRKNRGGSRVGGRRQGHGSRKDDLQRITRSQVRQIATNANEEDGTSMGLGRKRRIRPTMPGNYGLLEEEEDAMSGTAEASESGGTENAGEDERNNEDQRSEEDSRHSALAIRMIDCSGIRGTGEDAPQQQRQSLAASVLSKNSLEQSAAFEAMFRERWALQYKEHLKNVTERMESAHLIAQQQKPDHNEEEAVEISLFGSDAIKEWPEPLQKLYTDQSNRSQEMAEAHRLDRERIRSMMQREMARAVETQGQTMTTGERRKHFITAVSLLRDSECYDPTVFAEGATLTTRGFHTPSLSQIQQRFNYLVNTTKNRHAMEAHTLGESHRTEWNRSLRKIARENERQHLLKGPAGGKQLIKIPLECCSESVVPIVKLIDIPLVPFQNED